MSRSALGILVKAEELLALTLVTWLLTVLYMEAYQGRLDNLWDCISFLFAAIINYHKLSGLKNTLLFSYNSVVQKTDMMLPG